MGREIEVCLDFLNKNKGKEGNFVILCQSYGQVSFIFKELVIFSEIPDFSDVLKIEKVSYSRKELNFVWGGRLLLITPVWEKVASIEIVDYLDLTYEYNREIDKTLRYLMYRVSRNGG